MELLIIIPAVAIAFSIFFIYFISRYANQEPYFIESPQCCYLMVLDKIESAQSTADIDSCVDYVNDTMSDWIYGTETKYYYDQLLDKITEKKYFLNNKEYMQISMN
jgi:hypothetical protein